MKGSQEDARDIFVERLRGAIDQLGVSELSRLSGCSQQLLYNWLNKDNVPSLINAQRIADVFGLSLAEFLTDANSKKGISNHNLKDCFEAVSTAVEENRPLRRKLLQRLIGKDFVNVVLDALTDSVKKS